MVNCSQKIDQGIRRTGFDENFINAVKFHLNVIYSKVEASNIRSQYDYCNLLMSKLFIDKTDLYPTKRFKCQIKGYSDWPLPLLPSEVFGNNKLSDKYRRSSFYKCLQVGDILDCRVSSVLPTEYQFRVIHKYGATRILDDLNITVVMPRNDSELHLLKKELFPCELIRVLVSEIDKENENKILVTISDNIKELGECGHQLGRISEVDLPTYVLDPPEYSSTYSDYLKSSLCFRNPLLFDGITEGFGIDPKGVYTFYPTVESLKPVDANLLLKETNLSIVKYFTDLALQELENQNLDKALTSVEKAIDLYPVKNRTESDKKELCKLFEVRGIIHSAREKSKVSKSALADWRRALKMDPTSQYAIEQLSRVFFLAANKFYKAKNYEKAAESAEEALKINANNDKALELLNYLKSKHPEVFSNVDVLCSSSLGDLEEKKMKLENELKRCIKKEKLEKES